MSQRKRKKRPKKKISLHKAFLSKKNLIRDIVVIAISIGILILLIINNYRLIEQDVPFQPAVEDVMEQEAENPTVDATNWKSYKSQWYGFEVKYPENWNKPEVKNAPDGVNWEVRYQFRKQEIDENNPHIGFDIIVYNVNKVEELYNTDEFPTFKDKNLEEQGLCKEIKVPMADNEDYPAEQIYIDENDEHYNPTYFYTLTRDDYIYNVAPVMAEGKEVIQSKKEIIKNLPELITAVSTFNLIDIKRPTPVSTKPRTRAPMPAANTDRDGSGRMVCAKKNDHPSKSDKGKGKHLDMECCLDPDEYPNPNCYYSPSKYGKYL